tara:strand:- start:5200 stop:6810 length:1611 start_codon:yes stop_codon:yes gene_type:complete
MEPEKEEGNIEYKLKLLDLSPGKISKIATQMRYRCTEGGSECIYVLGVEDDGTLIGMTNEEYNTTIKCIQSAANTNSYTIEELSKTLIENTNRYVYELLIREFNNKSYIDIKITIAGSVDSGKSSLLGVLTSGKPDNGRGSARLSVFNFSHEMESGRTSSIGHHIVGYDKIGKNISYKNNRMLSWPEIINQSSKVISFYDLAGHEKYLKTTIFGLSSTSPDVCFIIVGANRGVLRMTREHIFLCVTLKIPFCIIITKIDMIENNSKVMEETISSINKIIKCAIVRKFPLKIKNEEDVIRSAIHLNTESIVPIFKISNTTLEGYNLLNKFLHLVPKREKINMDSNIEMHIDLSWSVPSVGTVIGGHLVSGTIRVGDKVWFGPNNNSYQLVTIRSIHIKKVSIQEAKAGSYICLGVRGISKYDFKKGNVILGKKSQQILCYKIKAEIEVLKSHSTTIKEGYQPILHVLNIRTSCIIEKIIEKNKNKTKDNEDNILRTHDKAIIILNLYQGPKFIKIGTNILLCEGRTKVIGTILEIYS